jgi:signal transduction histidine kinase/DNA-binding NarL/FixJ family response regulator
VKLNREQLYQVLDNLPGTLMVFFDEHLDVIRWTDPDQKLGKIFEGLAGLENLSSIHAAPWDEFLPGYCLEILGGGAGTRSIMIGKDTVEVHGSSLKDPEGKLVGLLILYLHEIEMMETHRELEREKEEAEESSEIKSRFMASISHEIRTPLNAIIGFIEQLQKTPLDDRQRNYLNIIDKSSVYLLDLVNEILTFSKIESGEQKLDNIDFQPESLFKELFQTFKIRAREKNINFRYSFDENLRLILRGDAFRLKQIVINLISNAIKFTEYGYVELRVERLKEDETNVWIRIKVIDTGIGISAKKLKEVFKEYKQASAGIARKHGGTGLGLTISKRLAELMNGKIRVESKEGKGSTFMVDIPLERSQKQFLSNDTLEINQEVLSGRRVLIVDDDAMNRLLGEIILEGFNMEVQLAADGNEAIEILGKDNFDIILLDIHMPEVSGPLVARYIRQEKKDHELKILAVTADMDREEMDRYLEEGIDDYIIKPFREASMFNKLCQMLDVDSKLIHQESTKILLKEEPGASLYDLEELRAITRGNPEFFNEMIHTFVENAEQGVRQIREAYSRADWEFIRETSHRLIPSYKHLSIHGVVSDLIELKSRAGKREETHRLKSLVDRIEKDTARITRDLAREIIPS